MVNGLLLVKEERRIESVDQHEDDDFRIKEELLQSTKVEMEEMREENERLKMILTRIVKDRQSLQLKFFDILQQEQAKKPIESTPSIPRDAEEPELVSLSLGSKLSGQKEEKKTTNKSKEDDGMEKGLTLGLDCKYEGSSSITNDTPSNLSLENSYEEPKEEEAGGPWLPSKIPKNPRNGDDDVSQQAQVKKARVSVRARCEAPTMHDGCQWRKYGQKIAKGNPCPRAYYRCTVAPSCPVRKQVQRCAEDMSILITTYEGTHNHSLPISATAMASTTSAAASMLISGSSTSNPTVGCPASTTTATDPNLHILNFGLSDNISARQLPQFYLPNPRISSFLSHPTITLDLTPPPPSILQPSQLYNRFPSSFTSNPKYPSSSLDFTCSESTINYGAQLPYNKTHIGPFINLNYRQSSQDHLYQKPVDPTQNPLTDTIANAIASDPSSQSALMSTITSYVGSQVGERI